MATVALSNAARYVAVRIPGSGYITKAASTQANAAPSTLSLTHASAGNDTAPSAAIDSSINANTRNVASPVRVESQPPARLPHPSPIMNAVTITVTASICTPKISASMRCQTSW